jgi:hypothetical protein
VQSSWPLTPKADSPFKLKVAPQVKGESLNRLYRATKFVFRIHKNEPLARTVHTFLDKK